MGLHCEQLGSALAYNKIPENAMYGGISNIIDRKFSG